MIDEAKIYQRIGEFVVCFQWLEHRVREIGSFILDPGRTIWPPEALRTDSTADLFKNVAKLFLDALPKCRLGGQLEDDFRTKFAEYTVRFSNLRRARNRILHSAFIEIKAGGDMVALLRSNPRLEIDAETGEPLFDEEALSENSFDREFREMADLALFLNRCYTQLLHRLPADDFEAGS